MYLFEGSGTLKVKDVPTSTLVALGTEDLELDFIVGDPGARFILISGKPIVQYGPFVMNTREEIDQAMGDF